MKTKESHEFLYDAHCANTRFGVKQIHNTGAIWLLILLLPLLAACGTDSDEPKDAGVRPVINLDSNEDLSSDVEDTATATDITDTNTETAGSDTGTATAKTEKSDTASESNVIDTATTVNDTVTATETKTSIYPPDTFVTKWNTGIVELPLVENGTYDFTVDWGDGSSDVITRWDAPERTHQYDVEGEYTIIIEGKISGWSFYPEQIHAVQATYMYWPTDDNHCPLVEVSQWGTLAFGDTKFQFLGCEELNISATDAPDLTQTTSLSGAFSNIGNFTNDNGSMNLWDMSHITEMIGMFVYTAASSGTIRDWDTSAVTDMSHMFFGTDFFYEDIFEWDVSSVTNMEQILGYNSFAPEQYNALLISWAGQDVRDGVRFDAGDSKYSGIDAATARTHLVTEHGWIISDKGYVNAPPAQDSFVLKTRKSEDGTLHLPLVENGIYDFKVHWGDGSKDIITSWDAPEKIHQYESGHCSDAPCTVEIIGQLTGWSFYPVNNPVALAEWKPSSNAIPCPIVEVVQWGDFSFGDTMYQFYGCESLGSFPADAPDLTGTQSLRGAFAYSGAALSGVETWDMSSVTDMSGMFQYSEFNRNIDAWDTSSVTDMSYMFHGASFDQDISQWDTSSVTNMSRMFRGAQFNQDIGAWNTSSVTNMSGMFYSANSFNQDIGAWDVSLVTDMSAMFEIAATFNQDISGWDTSNVTNMNSMFAEHHLFECWQECWDSICDMTVETCDIISFPVAFDQPLGSWNIGNVQHMEQMFIGGGFAAENYSDLLTGWATQIPQNSVEFDAGASTYDDTAAAARQKLIDDYGWTITDGGMI